MSRVRPTCMLTRSLLLVVCGVSLSTATAAPPKVIKAVPDNGATDVDPNLGELRVEFDQDMEPGGMSWCGGGDQFPEFKAKPRWESPRICVVAVKLKPDHEYVLSINCPSARNFKSKTGEAADPYPIKFHTAAGKAGTIAAGPPKVIKAVPDNGATDVDPNLGELRVEFDQDMEPGGMSWCGGGDKFPEFDGKPRWESPRICVVAVKLKPDHEYVLSVNCPSARNFQSKTGGAAEPYPIKFRTAPAKAGAPAAGAPTAGPPKVIKASPDNGATDVDPDLREIRIEFDQDMQQGGFSWCGGGEKFPEFRGTPHWDGPRVCVADVKLKPEYQYAFSINCPSAQNFRGKNDQPAEIYPITFRTGKAKSGGSESSTLKEDNKASVKALRRAVDEHYSYRDLRNVDWDKEFAEATPRLEKAETASEWAREAAALLAKAKDIHITLTLGDARFATHRRAVPANCNLEKLRQLVPHWKKLNKWIVSGRFDDGIGYILISSWSFDDSDALDPAFEALETLGDTKGLLVDVRLNAGGDEPTAAKFAGCFVEEPVVYSKNVYRAPDTSNGFTDPLERVLEPTKARPKFRGKVAVLMGPHNMSSCESFLLMMKQMPGCKLVGDTTYGSSGNPKPYAMPNGVTVLLPSWQDMLPDGTLLEGKGIEPDIRVKTGQKDLETADPVLEAALKYLRG